MTTSDSTNPRQSVTAQRILATAEARGRDKAIPYRGLVTPQEAWELAQTNASVVVDTRTKAELDWVGRVPGAIHIEWYSYPSRERNLSLVAAMKAQFALDTWLFLLCRTANRSNWAGEVLVQEGFSHAFNILEGFEGAKNPVGQRRCVDGRVHRGLPWEQE